MINVRGLPYFAYGSNLSVGGMAGRCPTATRIGRARLDGWRLTFRGVADIEPAEGELVEGALWTVTPKDVRSLDQYEGAPHLYDREVVEVVADGKKVKAFTYVMTSRHEVGLPSPYYYGIIEQGYEDFGIELSLLERSLSDLRARHSLKPVAYYEPRGKKRLMAVLESDLYEDEFAADDDFLDSMSPATRALYDLEERSRQRGRQVPISREERQALRVGEYA